MSGCGRTGSLGAAAALRAGLLLPAAVLLAACTAPVGGGADTAGTGGPAGGRVVVFGAASLTDVLAELAADLERAQPGTEVVVNPGASSSLAAQLLAGAPADVLVSAAPEPVQQLEAAGLTAGPPEPVARNSLVLAVPAGNPGGVTGLADLAREELVVGLCAVEVPCGAAAERLLEQQGVTAAPDTYARDARALLRTLSLDEVDAGLVYRTDAFAAGAAVTVVEVPGAADVVNDYPVVVLAEAPNPRGAEAFVDLLTSERGRSVLADAGFGLP